MDNLILNKNLELLKSLIIKERVSELNAVKLKLELRYLECNPSDLEYVLKFLDHLKQNKLKTENKNNSIIYFLCGATDSEPSQSITQTPMTLPDVDYDTDARDEIKKYLQDKYGENSVSLLGTFNTLKTKSAFKDAVKFMRKDMPFQEVNDLTKCFNVFKREKFESEEEYFKACVNGVSELSSWFAKNKDVYESVIELLGNVKSTGIHAGGIVIANKDLRHSIPLSYESEDKIWVTQPEMSDVESSGLIKYDFLGLKTIKQINICKKLIKSRYGIDLDPSLLDMEDMSVLEEFTKGNVTSVFQFDTNTVRPSLKRLKSIDSINDLSLITALHRPGPMESGMVETFIARKSGLEPITYLHPSLKKHLEGSYGVLIYQESIMSIVVDLGGISPDDSVVVLKAMSKKVKEKLVKFKDQFISNCFSKYQIEKTLAETIWDQVENFCQYGFNKSHSLAYASVGYVCMYYKKYYPLEWTSAVLQTSDGDDFKQFYKSWSESVQKPDINKSKPNYSIDYAAGQVVMPFSSINKVGDKSDAELCSKQPFSSFEDLYDRVDGRKVNKANILSLIFAGAFDSMRDPATSMNKHRKELVIKLYELRHKAKKPSKDDLKTDSEYVMLVQNMTRLQMINKEIGLLNFTALDYHEIYKEYFNEKCISQLGGRALKPIECMEFKNKSKVIVGGAVESIEVKTIKKEGKLKGKKMLSVVVTSPSGSIEVVIFPDSLEGDLKAGGSLALLKENDGFIVKGTISHFNDKVSVVYDQSIMLS